MSTLNNTKCAFLINAALWEGKINPIKGPWMLKVEWDLGDQALKCMVRGILMAEFREIQVFDPIALPPIVICTSVCVLFFFMFKNICAQVMCCTHVIKIKNKSSCITVLTDSYDLPACLLDYIAVVEKFISFNGENTVKSILKQTRAEEGRRGRNNKRNK